MLASVDRHGRRAIICASRAEFRRVFPEGPSRAAGSLRDAISRVLADLGHSWS